MGLISLFKAIDERDEKVVFRDNTGIHILPLTMLGAGLIIFAVAVPALVFSSGSDQEVFVLTAVLSGLSVVVGLFFRMVSPKTVVDFRREDISERSIRRDFDDLACIVLTERIQVVHSKNNRHEIPMFRVLMGFGSVDRGVLEEQLDKIRAENPGGSNFIAGESALDEHLADALMRDTDLESFELVESSGYPVLWRTSHRLARAAEAAYIDLTGSNFTIARGEDVDLSLAERLQKRGYTSAKEQTEHDDVTITEEGDRLSIGWHYSLLLPLTLVTLIGGGATFAFAVIPEFSGVLAIILGVVFGVPTLLIIWWLLGRHGRHRLTIEDGRVRYSRPSGSETREFSLDELYELYVRPNVSGGMSVLLLLTHGEPVVVRGKLASLEVVDDAIRGFLASTSES